MCALGVNSGTMMLLPVAIILGEVWTFKSLEDKVDKLGFLDRDDLHTPGYLLLNLFAGKLVVDVVSSDDRRYLL